MKHDGQQLHRDPVVDEALEDMATRAQAHRIERQGGFQSLYILARALHLPLMNSQHHWESHALALTGTLYDSIALLRSLPPAPREQYLSFLRHSFERLEVWHALQSLERLFKVELWPDFDYGWHETLLNEFLVNGSLCEIAYDPESKLRKHMAMIAEATLADDHQFFRCLQKAIDWEPSTGTLTCRALAALPEGKSQTPRTAIRRFWVSRGFWMMPINMLFVVCPDLSQSAADKLTAKSQDKLHREVVYTQISDDGTIVSENADVPRIAKSTVDFT